VPYTQADLPELLTDLLPAAARESADATQARLVDMSSAEVAESAFVDSVSLDEALRLYTHVRDTRPSITIELGMFTGGSTLAILKALEDNGHGEHYVCDPFQSSLARGAGLRNVERAGLAHRLRFEEEFPESVVPRWPAAGFAFIDASHLYDLTMLDFVLVDKRLPVGSLLGLHDMWMPSLQKVVRWAVTNRGYEVVVSGRRPLGRRERIRSRLAAVLRRGPRADALFAQELLRPWHEIEPSGDVMIFLRKTREDDRHWRDYRPF
jgi:predicted O-methyltransferase YrrM